MQYKHIKRNTLFFLLIAALSLTFIACKKTYKPVKPDSTEPTKLVQDKDYTKDLKKESEVLDGQVYVQNNMVIGTMIIKENVEDDKAKKLAEDYAKKLKETYKDMKVNVQAVKAGKNIASINLE